MKSLTAVKNVLFSFVNNLLNLLNGVVLSVIIARYLGPQNLGAFHLVTWTVSIALLFVNLGIVMSLKKHVAEYEGQNDRRSVAGVINFMIGIRIVAASVVTALLIVFSGPISNFFNLPDSFNGINASMISSLNFAATTSLAKPSEMVFAISNAVDPFL